MREPISTGWKIPQPTQQIPEQTQTANAVVDNSGSQAADYIPYKKPGICKKKVAAYIFTSIISITIWHNIIVPAIEYYFPEYSIVSEKMNPDIADLLEASKKNCQLTNFNRRACKAIWANIPVSDISANWHP